MGVSKDEVVMHLAWVTCLVVGKLPRLVAAMQHATSPGLLEELGTITRSAVSRVSAQLLCSSTRVARRRDL